MNTMVLLRTLLRNLLRNLLRTRAWMRTALLAVAALALALGPMLVLVPALTLVPAPGLAAPPASTAAGGVGLLAIDGAIGPASADYIVRGIERSAARGHKLLILKMDTPGGLDTSMRSAIKAILTSPLPVAAYVAPSGARARAPRRSSNSCRTGAPGCWTRSPTPVWRCS